ncbi:RNA polymerase sigma-70 factor [Parapedobacter lycopersici]|uniref:RNA polymerase sigma-70 factor n=1 Tax=Parapedobacter lycopersici TaxID=1864939 RepID=UPI00333E3B92
MKHPRLYNEPELLRLIVEENDEIAFRKLFDHYVDRLCGYACKIVKSEEIAEEIVMNVFLKIWLNHHKLLTIARFDAYLYSIVRNQSLNVIKRAEHELRIIRELSQTNTRHVESTEETVIYNDYKQLLHQTVDRLPPQQRLIYLLSREEGLKYDEIAVNLSLSKNTVKSHLKKAISTLRNVLNYGLLL